MTTKDDIRRWLLAKGVTLWGAYDLSQPSRLEAAVDWLYGEIVSLETFTDRRNPAVRVPPPYEPPYYTIATPYWFMAQDPTYEEMKNDPRGFDVT